jgi:hypothetical protein
MKFSFPDHLLHVPNAQPPLPSDWEVRPTYPVHHVPYYLAPLWDAGVRHRAEEIAAEKKLSKAKKAGKLEEKGRVPQELRQKLKKSKGAKSLLQDLEEEVRKFVQDYENRQQILGKMREEEMDSEDEEIVFVGRNGSMSDEQRTIVEEELQREKLVFDSLADDHGASFGYVVVLCLNLPLTNSATDAGLFIPLPLTTVSHPAQSLSAIQLVVRLTLVSRKSGRAELLLEWQRSFPVLCGV